MTKEEIIRLVNSGRARETYMQLCKATDSFEYCDMEEIVHKIDTPQHMTQFADVVDAEYSRLRLMEEESIMFAGGYYKYGDDIRKILDEIVDRELRVRELDDRMGYNPDQEQTSIADVVSEMETSPDQEDIPVPLAQKLVDILEQKEEHLTGELVDVVGRLSGEIEVLSKVKEIVGSGLLQNVSTMQSQIELLMRANGELQRQLNEALAEAGQKTDPMLEDEVKTLRAKVEELQAEKEENAMWFRWMKRENVVKYIASKNDAAKRDDLISLVQAMLPKDMHDEFQDEVDDQYKARIARHSAKSAKRLSEEDEEDLAYNIKECFKEIDNKSKYEWAIEFIRQISGTSNSKITDTVRDWSSDAKRRIAPNMKSWKWLGKYLYDAGLYTSTSEKSAERNWGQRVNK